VEKIVNAERKDSRIDKFEKRRKTTKSITLLIIIGAALIILLLFIWIFGGSDKESEVPDEASNEIQRNDNESNDLIIEDDTDEDVKEEKDTNNNEKEAINEDKDKEKDSEEKNKDKKEEEEEDKDAEKNHEVETEQVESPDDNVSKAYKGDWKPIETEQSGQHTTNYDDESQDRKEMEKAIKSVTGLDDDMILWWVGNDGDQQKVVATVSPSDNSKTYRVYLSWIDNNGWKPTKVEELKVNDKR